MSIVKTMKPFISIFFVIAALELWAEATQDIQLRYFTKPLLLTILSIYFYFQTKSNTTRFSTFIFYGLVFSIGGDTLLMFQGDDFFMGGLVCFLMTHVFYTLAFFNYLPKVKGFIGFQPFWIIPFLLFWIGFNVYLWNDLGDLQLPVLLYSGVITAMAVSALNLKTKLPSTLFWTLFLGVLLFMFSDSVIALNKFKGDELNILYPSLWIMITYITAQYLIMKSCLKANGLLE